MKRNYRKCYFWAKILVSTKLPDPFLKPGFRYWASPSTFGFYRAVVCSTMTKEIVRFRGEWLQHNNLSKVSYLTFNGLFYNLRECSEEESIKTLQIRKNMHLLLRQGPF